MMVETCRVVARGAEQKKELTVVGGVALSVLMNTAFESFGP